LQHIISYLCYHDTDPLFLAIIYRFFFCASLLSVERARALNSPF